MNKEKYLKELNAAFGDFKFFESDHHYEYKGERVGISVTTLIDQYSHEFKKQEMAERVASKRGVPVADILNDWDYRAKFATTKGTTCHEYAQAKWVERYWERIDFDGSYEYFEAVEKIKKQADNFKKDYRDRFEHLADEFIIGSSEYDIASAVDHLFINKFTGELIMVDYKTNSDIYKNDKYARKMKVPLNKLKDNTINHYALQLSIYKFLIEKYTNIKISEFFIVWFSEKNDNYTIIEVPYLENEVIKILENRRSKNMKSVPVLIIGQSGTGKSASLRNFKKDEIAIANVLGKPLPFQSDIEAPKVDDYGIIMRSIEKTDKKTIVIDDAGYLLTNQFMEKVSVKGYDKYNEMASEFFNLINGIKNVEGGKTVYLIMHEDTDDLGFVKPKTMGKLLDDKVNIQGMFTVCLRSMFENGKYIFRVKTNGQDCVKTPIGMFEESEIDNDLKLVDEKIREYYNLDKEINNE